MVTTSRSGTTTSPTHAGSEPSRNALPGTREMHDVHGLGVGKPASRNAVGR